jgi:hypothetical protein
MGPPLKGAPTQCPDSCVGDLLEVDPCVGAPSFSGNPHLREPLLNGVPLKGALVKGAPIEGGLHPMH